MIEQSPNPFESPQAVVPPIKRTVKWQPTWRACIGGCLIACIFTGAVLAALIQSSDEYAAQEPFSTKVFVVAVFVPLLIPILLLRTFNVLNSFTLLLVWLLILLAFLCIAHAEANGRYGEPYGIAVVFWMMFGLPLIIFAFYLAYLRRAPTAPE